MKIVNVEEMRRLEQATDTRGHSYAAMMALAGGAVANVVEILGLAGPMARALILVGPGNNGGDGLVAARYLREHDHEITLYVWRRDIKGDENFRKLKQRRRGLTILWADNDPGFTKLREEVARAEVIIDALLGTGATRPIEGQLADLLTTVREEVNARRIAESTDAAESPLGIPRFPLMEALTAGLPPPQPPSEPEDDDFFSEDFDEEAADEEAAEDGAPDEWEDEPDDFLPNSPWPPLPIVAVDCPSGLNCDTGALDPVALHASITVTFAYPKWGQLQYPGAGACGLLCVADIGTPPDLDADLRVSLLSPLDVAAWLPARPVDAHKGTFGKALIVAGSLNYTGAAALSASAATRAGAGLVTLAIPAPLHVVLAGALPEITWLPLPGSEGIHTAAGAARLLASLAGYDAVLIGPGLTATEEARGFIETIFAGGGLDRAQWQGRIVIDADALNLLAGQPGWPARLPPQSILTPHPGEMSRLTGLPVAEVNARRIENARRWAAEWGHVVLLKGPHTVVAAPDGRAAVLPFALPTLATAGSGDVLAGAIVALLAQGLPAFEAAAVGAYLHGHAGLVLGRMAPAGHVASDILVQFPEALRQLHGVR